MQSATSNRFPARFERTSLYASRPLFLSKMINSMPGISAISPASVLPMIHVSRVSGHVSCMARTTANAWQVSPI